MSVQVQQIGFSEVSMSLRNALACGVGCLSDSPLEVQEERRASGQLA